MADRKSILLSEEQLNFIKRASAGKNMLVDAPEGYGKTTALIELCERLPNRKRILFFASDRVAKNDVEEVLKKRNVTVAYFHGFAFKELRKIGVYGEPEELINLFNKVNPDVSEYDLLIADEFQFIDAGSSQMLKNIKYHCDNLQIILAGNTANRFYDKKQFDAKIFADELLGEHEEMRFANCYEVSEYSSDGGDRLSEAGADGEDYASSEDLAETVPASVKKEPVKRLGDGIKIAVVDAELNKNNEVMSVGAVVADSETFEISDERYFIITPENLEGGMFLKELRTGDCINAPAVSREEALQRIAFFLRDNNVKAIYAYNAAFDRGMLPELAEFTWYDIMKLAAYKKYNPAIGQAEACDKNGRLKKDFGVGSMIRRMTGDVSFTETHNALYDARDELKVMELLDRPVSDYEFARVEGDLSSRDDFLFQIEGTNDVVLEDDAISATDAEIILGINKNNIYKLVRKGLIFGYKRDNRYVLSKRSVKEYLEKLEAAEAKKYKKALLGILTTLLGFLIYLWHLAANFY